MLRDFLPIQLIYKGRTARCHPKFNFLNDWDITHAPKHWSNEDTMHQYIENVIVSYVKQVRADVGSDKTALVIMDNFKGPTTEAILTLLVDYDILVSLLLANTTADLQQMDISVNKPAKGYIKHCSEEWYANEIVQQLEENENEEEEEVCPKPVNLSLPLLKELGAKWLVGMAESLWCCFPAYIDTPCVGNPDTKFSAIGQCLKGCFRSVSGKRLLSYMSCVLYSFIIILTAGMIVDVFDARPLPAPTIQHQECSLLIAKDSVRCAICTHYLHSLNAMLSCSKSTEDKMATTSHTITVLVNS